MSLAVIKTGGKQYLVKKGDKIKVEKLSANVGDVVKFDTLLVTDENGSKVEVGSPLLKSSVEAKVLEQSRAKKISVTKYKAKTRYSKTTGHRQEYSVVEIQKI